MLDLQLTDRADVVATSVLSNFIEACLWNVAQSDNQTIIEAIISFNLTAPPPVTIFTENVTDLLTEIEKVVCPGTPECSSHGRCTDGNCVCDTGFVGVDCSLPVATPPVIVSHLPGPICDISGSSPCTVVTLHATGFSYVIDKFACQIRLATSATVYYTRSRLVSVAEVQCYLPTSLPVLALPAYEWLVAVSNDNVTFSATVSVLVYDSVCVACSGNTASTCTLKAGSCLIANRCYAANEASATDKCLRCLPTVSTTAFTHDDSVEGCATWGPWSDWGECTTDCDNRQRTRSRVCLSSVPSACVGESSESESCPTTGCDVDPEEEDDGVDITFPGSDGLRLTSSEHLSFFFSAISVTINRFCFSRPQYACSRIIVNSRFTFTSSFTVVRKSYIRIGKGFPRVHSVTSSSSVKLMFQASVTTVETYCTVTSGRRRRQSESVVTLDKHLMAEALQAGQAELEQMLNTTMNITASTNATTTSSPVPTQSTQSTQPTQTIIIGAVVGAAALGVVIIGIICLVLISRRGNKPNRPTFRGNARVAAHRRRLHYPVYNAQFVPGRYVRWSYVH